MANSTKVLSNSELLMGYSQQNIVQQPFANGVFGNHPQVVNTSMQYTSPMIQQPNQQLQQQLPQLPQPGQFPTMIQQFPMQLQTQWTQSNTGIELPKQVDPLPLPPKKGAKRAPKVVDPNKPPKPKKGESKKKVNSEISKLSLKVQVSKCTGIVKQVMNGVVQEEIKAFKEANSAVFDELDRLIKKRSEISRAVLKSLKEKAASSPDGNTVVTDGTTPLPDGTGNVDGSVAGNVDGVSSDKKPVKVVRQKREKTPEEAAIAEEIAKFAKEHADVVKKLKDIKVGVCRINSKASMVLALLVDRMIENAVEWGFKTISSNPKGTLNESLYSRENLKANADNVVFLPLVLKNIDEPSIEIANEKQKKDTEKVPRKERKDKQQQSVMVPQQIVDSTGNVITVFANVPLSSLTDPSGQSSGEDTSKQVLLDENGKPIKKKRIVNPDKSPFHTLVNNKFKEAIKRHAATLNVGIVPATANGCIVQSDADHANKSTYKLGGYAKELLSLVVRQFLKSFSLMLKHALSMHKIKTVSYETMLTALRIYFIACNDEKLLHYSEFEKLVKTLLPQEVKEKKPRPPKKVKEVTLDISQIPEDGVTK